ncbi:MAG TPA: YaaR family protein [Clostridia bacterium]|jgi:uncharacterized protein YaaR (DUF327 family)|nr:YaaR family protein [Clostridia bacterium]HHY05895.1 YaaR family protein [Clostridia bacterium]
MRIQNKKLRKSRRSRTDKKSTVAKNKQVLPSQQTFKDVLQEENFVFGQEKLDLFLDDLDEIGERLVKTFSLHDLLAYKKLLGGFLDESLQQIYGLKKETGWAPTGRPKLYQRIELLNQEVEELTQLVLKKQQDPVQVLAKLDSIRGLLVDLYS